jgi:hypothetical protein
MNAWNFGWKLALVANGTAPAALLGTYQAERQTVGRNVLWLTTGPSPSPPRPARLGRFVRTRVAPLLAQFAARFPAGRAAGFRTLSQLAIGYTTAPQSSTAAPSGGRAGRRRATVCPTPRSKVDGRPTTLHRECAAPRFRAPPH